MKNKSMIQNRNDLNKVVECFIPAYSSLTLLEPQTREHKNAKGFAQSNMSTPQKKKTRSV